MEINGKLKISYLQFSFECRIRPLLFVGYIRQRILRALYLQHKMMNGIAHFTKAEPLTLSLCSVCRNIYVYGFSVFRHNNSSNPLLIYLEWEHFLSSLFVPSFPSFASSVFRFFPLCSVFGSLASIFKIHTLIRQNCMKVYKS